MGLALGSGSARGLAHIGVLRALQEAGIAVDVVAGTSIGALIGAIHAAGRLDGLQAFFQSLDWLGMMRFVDVVLPKSGLIDGARITALVREHVAARTIEALPKPFAAVATDLASSDPAVLRSGDVIEAVRASISVPGIFTPVRYGGRILVDGGLVDPVPVTVARALGAEFVIAVDLNHGAIAERVIPRRPARKPTADGSAIAVWARGIYQAAMELPARLRSSETPAAAQLARWSAAAGPMPNIFEVLLASINIMEARITESRLASDPPDLLIRPPLAHIRLLDFGRAEEIVEIGYQAARSQFAAAVR
ncbi:MAG: patatin-like phospholipase family protein [Rhodopila sp.]